MPNPLRSRCQPVTSPRLKGLLHFIRVEGWPAGEGSEKKKRFEKHLCIQCELENVCVYIYIYSFTFTIIHIYIYIKICYVCVCMFVYNLIYICMYISKNLRYTHMSSSLDRKKSQTVLVLIIWSTAPRCMFP